MNLVDFRNRVEALGEDTGPYLTLSLDLSPDATGRPVAHIAFRAALAEAAAALPASHDFADQMREPVEAIIDEATGGGSRGLFLVARPGGSVRLDSHLAFRNDVRLGPLPWTFELERELFVLGAPVVAIEVNRSEVAIFRITEAEVTERETLARDEHWTRKTRGRTDAETSGATGIAAGGHHSWSTIERTVEEHRASDAREAVEALRRVWGHGDMLLVTGSPEPRSELLHHLPDEVRSALLPESPHTLPGDERGLLELVADISVERQLGLGNELVAAIMSGAGENIARGRQAVDGALQQGRVDTLVVHEDVAGHWGRAGDSRHHQPPWDDAPYEAMLRRGRGSSAEIMFCQAPELIEQHEGVAARLRW